MKRALAAAAAALVAAAPFSARSAPRQKVAVLDVRAVQGVAPGTATILTAIIAGDTASAGYDVLSQADIGALIGFERQKKMLGCGDDSSCLAEIGGALGAEYVLSTQVGKIGSRFHLSLQLLDARKGNVVARVSTFSETTEDALAATAQRAVAQALASAKERAAANGAARAGGGKPSTPTPTPTPTSTSTSTSTATPTSTSTAGDTAVAAGGSFFTRHPVYVEFRPGLGWNRAPIDQSSGVKAFDGPSLGLRAGLKLAPAWSVEVGAATRKLRHTETQYSYLDYRYATGGDPTHLDVLTEVSAISFGAGAVYAPPVLRGVSFAADAGVARVKAKQQRAQNDPRFNAAPPPSSGTLGPVTDSYLDTVPRFGLELRFDYPLRWVTLGVRAGLDLAKTAARQTVRNPYLYDFSGAGGEPTDWINAGWLVSYPVDLSIRYVF